jgi:hypothetical protein
MWMLSGVGLCGFVVVVVVIDCIKFLNRNVCGKNTIDLGRGVFERSIAALLKLNKAGYGTKEHPELELDLVYNPGEFHRVSKQQNNSQPNKLWHIPYVRWSILARLSSEPRSRLQTRAISNLRHRIQPSSYNCQHAD